MKQLKIKIWNIENVVLMKVLQQDESLRNERFIFESKNDFCIQSYDEPDIFEDGIHIQGLYKYADNKIACHSFPSVEDAEEYVMRIKDMLKEYNESIREVLNKEEKEYLKAVIKPFRSEVKCIVKNSINKEKEHIAISLKNDFLFLPNFRVGSMYKGMEIDRRYTLEELGL